MSKTVYFIGGVWKKEDESKIIEESIGNVQMAANVFQTNIIEGLDSNLTAPVTILNQIFIGSFPKKYKKAIINSGYWNHSSSPDHVDYNVKFLNLPLVKHFSRYNNLKNIIRQICDSNKEEKIYFIGYSMTYSVVKALRYAQRYDDRVKTCLIIPDLPEYMNLGRKRGKVFRFVKSAISTQLYQEIKYLDSFVTLTNLAFEKLEVNKPFAVVEGIAPKISTIKELDTVYIKKIVYTGTLDEKYGIMSLIEAFMKIKNDNAKLIICGEGDTKDNIIALSKIDDRIEYLGKIPNDDAKKLQSEAYFLINPRSNKEEYTKYSFPSKTLEYMTSGRPVLMYKLAGIPDEYDDYLFYIGSDMSSSIQKLLAMEPKYLTQTGIKARDFVIKNKDKTKQTKKIVDLLDDLK